MVGRASGGQSRRGGPCFVVALSVATVLAFVACGGDRSTERAAGKSAAAGTGNVRVRDLAFTPSALSVKVGTTVTWTNGDGTAHTATSGRPPDPDTGLANPDGMFNGTMDGAGKTFTFTFDRPGIFTYFCSRHPGQMQGTVTVG